MHVGQLAATVIPLRGGRLGAIKVIGEEFIRSRLLYAVQIERGAEVGAIVLYVLWRDGAQVVVEVG